MASYATVETALARLHDANPEVQRGAFRGRLKHFQRLGLPLGERPGKGSRINYDAQQIWQLAFALELSECGIDPTKIAQIIRELWKDFISVRVDEAIERFGSRDELVEFYVSFMSEAWTGKGVYLEAVSAEAYKDRIRPYSREKRRIITVNLRRMVEELTKHLSDLGENITEE